VKRAMTSLRQQLLTAGREYDAVRYPGDLAAELLRSRSRPARGLTVPAAGAVAAAIILGAMLARPAFSPVPTQQRASLPLVSQVPSGPTLRFALPSIPPLPGLSSHLAVVPTGRPISAPREFRLPPFSGIQPPTFPSKPEAI